jgi:hypothetical protein
MVSVTVKGTDGSGSAVSYTVNTQANAENVWKVYLKPEDKGGDYTVSASNSGGTVVLERVTFGDVYLCSGQSNSKSVSIATSGSCITVVLVLQWRSQHSSPSVPTLSKRPLLTRSTKSYESFSTVE